MNPSNPTNNQPLIYRICDSLGVFHIVAPVNHTHAQSEVSGLTEALNDKANVSHGHESIGGTGSAQDASVSCERATVRITAEDKVVISIEGQDVSLNVDNYDNLVRALANPDSTPTSNSNKLVTSGGVKEAIEKATDVIISDNPLDISTFEKKCVYTAILTNSTGDVIQAGEYLDVSNLPSAEQNIIFNSGMTDVPDGEQFGIRFIRTDQGVYAFFDGILSY